MADQEYGLGRIEFMHPKAANYPIQPLLAAPARKRDHPWPRAPFVVNQGNSGTCTAAALLAILGGLPIKWSPKGLHTRLQVDEPTESDPVASLIMALYRSNVARDWWSSNDYEADKARAPRLTDLKWGSSVDAAMMTGRALGFWEQVRWCQSARELDEWIRRVDGSPAEIGINWYQEWFNPPADGVIRSIGRSVAGGHALKVRWHYPRKGLWLIDNSWGGSWGLGGSIYMTDGVFEQVVFAEHGECAVSVEVKG